MRLDVIRDYIRLIVEASMPTRRGFEKARTWMMSSEVVAPETFSGSKMVDELGNPLVFYHGTRQDFAEFRKEMLNTSGTAIATNYIGFYFTTSPEVARVYASKRFDPSHGLAPTGRIDAVILNVKKPYYITERTYWKWGRGSPTEMDDMVTILKSKGYDGIVMPAVWRGSGKGAFDVVVFDPDQIHKLTS